MHDPGTGGVRRHGLVVVHADDGVRFAASAPDRPALMALLAGYVRERFEYTLWPERAAQVRALFDADDVDGAIETYFAHVGSRWDAERLELVEPEGAVVGYGRAGGATLTARTG